MQTYFYLHVCGQKGPIMVTASACVARLDAEGGLYLDPQSVWACVGCVPEVNRIYCDSQGDPLGDEETRFTISEAPGQPGKLSVTTFMRRPQSFEQENVVGPWSKAVVQALRDLPECSAGMQRAARVVCKADGALGQMVWQVAPEPA